MIKPIEIKVKPGQRMLVTSDIHGWPGLLSRLLRRADYRPGEDLLFILGDIVEKGPDSLGALELVYELAKSPGVYVLRGNVDRWLGRLFTGDAAKALSYNDFRPENCLSQAAERQGIAKLTADNIAAVRQAYIAENKDKLDFVATLPVCAAAGDYILTHSGLPADGTLNGEAEDFTSNYNFYRRRKNATGRTVIHGHIPCYYLNGDTSYNPHFDNENRVISIDGGTVSYSLQVNMLIIRDGKIDWIAEDPLESAVVTADVAGDMSGLVKILPDYDESRDNTRVEILEKGEYFSKVRCIGTNQTGLAKNELILPDGRCYAGLSAFLPAAKGDRIKIVMGGLGGYTYVKNAAGQLGFLPNGVISR